MARLLVCLDKFRGSLSAGEACAALVAGVLAAAPEVEVETVPVADGGEGTLDCLVAAGFERRTAVVPGPLGEHVRAAFALRGELAVLEMAQASGLALLERPTPSSASTATSAGTGELIRAALDAGATRAVLAVGGSATTDGGAGALTALGARVLCGETVVEPGGAALAGATRVELTGLDPRLRTTRFLLAADVDNPLLGPNGAAAVFAPQKGAGPDETRALEAGLTRFADLVAAATGRERRDAPGAGAAGGLGFAALAVLGADRVAGIDFVIEQTRLAERVAHADLIVVGEGRLDRQTLGGKAPAGVAALARGRCPVVAVAGQILLDPDQLRAMDVDSSWSLLERAGGDADAAMSRAPALLREIGRDIGARLHRG